MLRLPDRDLSSATAAYLQSRQAEIDAQPDFGQRADRADDYWTNKTAIKTGGSAAFEEIEATLRGMSTVEDMCQYCEMGEASDIEHVAPKMLFPGFAFRWHNYLLVCKQCNTGKKLDQMYVFVAPDTSEVVRAKRGREPASQEIAFFNPRVENPMDCLRINVEDLLFEPIRVSGDATGRCWEKATRTIEILELNVRRRLVNDRKDAFRDYTNQLKVYADAVKSENFQQLQQATSGYPVVAAEAGDFEKEKERVLNILRAGFSRTSHPTVLCEMLRQSGQLSKELQANIQASGIPDWLSR